MMPDNTNGRVLFISYAFPPVGGAGVQRVTKFIKYLRALDWRSSVLTVANPSVPVLDRSLIAELPSETAIVRSRTWEPGYAAKQSVASSAARARRGGVKASVRKIASRVLQPDPQVLWSIPAYAAGARLLRRVPHDAIVVSGPPFSTFVLGAMLSRRFDVPLVLDYRDEWDLTNQYWENKQLGAVSLELHQRLQQLVVRQAAALVATTTLSARRLDAVRERAGSRAAVCCIYNGYDPDDFSSTRAEARGSAPFRLVYTGTLWSATSIAPLVSAVGELTRLRPDLARDLEIVIAGRVTPEQQVHVHALSHVLAGRLVQRPYVEHASALALMASADALCLLLSDLPGIARVMPAKTFEYLAARKPILAVVPPGEAADVLQRVPHASVCDPADPHRLAACLAERIEVARRGDAAIPAGWTPAAFDRCTQAGELAALLARVTGRVAASQTGTELRAGVVGAA